MKKPKVEEPKNTVLIPAEKMNTLLWVDILEAKPNKMFTEDQRQTVRFLRFNRSVPCAECGRKRKMHWTMLCDFKAATLAPFVVKEGTTILKPLTPVCTSHPLALGWKEGEAPEDR